MEVGATSGIGIGHTGIAILSDCVTYGHRYSVRLCENGNLPIRRRILECPEWRRWQVPTHGFSQLGPLTMKQALRWATEELQLLLNRPAGSCAEELLAAEKALSSAGSADELAEASLAIAEATLSTRGPGSSFEEALKKAREAGSDVRLEGRLLQVQARAALARRPGRPGRPGQALEFARRMLELPPGEPEQLGILATGIVSISQRQAGSFAEAIAAAQRVQQVASESKSRAEAIGWLLSASAWLSSLPSSNKPRSLILVDTAMRGEGIKGAPAELAEAAAKECLQASQKLGCNALHAAALDRLVESLLRQGRAEEAQRICEEEAFSARKGRSRSEAGALAALVSAMQPGPAHDIMQVVGRLRTLGREGEVAQIQVSLLAAKSVAESADAAEPPAGSLDAAASHAQRALVLARRHRDFGAEAEALRLLTQLHRQMGLEPPRSELHAEILSELRSAVLEAEKASDAAPVKRALHRLRENGKEVESFLSPADLTEVLEPLQSWMPEELAPAMLLAGQSSEGQGSATMDPSLVMVEIGHKPMYSSVGVGGIQYGPRYRQVRGYRPPGSAQPDRGKPAVVAVLRTSSAAEEWEARSWDWTPPLVDAAAHSSFLFAQRALDALPLAASKPLSALPAHPRMNPPMPLAPELMWAQRTPFYPTWPTPSQASRPGPNRAGNPKWSLATGVALGIGAHIRCRAHSHNGHNRDLSPLPLPCDSWALVTGAASGLGQKLATACAEAGFGLVLTDEESALQNLDLAQIAGSSTSDRILRVPSSLADPSKGASDLYEKLKDLDVCMLMLCSDQFSYTGPFLSQSVEKLDRMLAQNVGATAALCRLFASDMVQAKRGRILLVGAPAGSTPGIAGACAFAGSMAFVRSLADGLGKELADQGVGISCLESSSLGRDGSLTDALASTCVGFLIEAEAETPPPEPATSSSSETRVAPGQNDVELEDSWNEEYLRLANEENFKPLPYAAEIDRLQHAPLSEISNALLAGLACAIYVVARSPGVTEGTIRVLAAAASSINALFFLDYMARWWCRGMSWQYLLNPLMIVDLIGVLPFLLRPWVPSISSMELNFLKLIRVLRIYRFFRPKAFRSFLQILIGPDQAKPYEDGLRGVKSYQLQVFRTFGVVFTLIFVTAGLCYEAEHTVNPQFADIFSSFYFSVIALSTVGFGDIEPMTWAP
ncbi:unnamed protein product [Symbiodinium sp. KB8]|nr:unnamed protein product [Symbiodinium sp. KB8]